MPERKTIIWDWNGTLLNDINICLKSINSMLQKRTLPQLSIECYRDIFTFPVIEYYKTAGFDFEKESWEVAAIEFIDKYISELTSCGLSVSAKEALEKFKKSGYRQAIVSAMQHDELVKSVTQLGIAHYFESIGGIGDHFAHSKLENAKNYFSENKINPSTVTWIGDTLHDAEIATELGCNCILVANGHQSKERLEKTGVKVIENLGELLSATVQ